MEARNPSRVSRKNAAFEVKAEGNERFRNGRLRSALECYEEAGACVCVYVYVRLSRMAECWDGPYLRVYFKKMAVDD